MSALEEKLTSGFVVVLEDTSELLRAQKAAAWHEVARRVAHEIKNPLTPIALSAERIARQLDRLELPPATDRILHECAATIAKSVESVKTLVDEFSQFARFPAAQPVRCDLNEVVAEALAVFHGPAGRHRDPAPASRPNLPPVNVDREQFQRVVVNLVDNAAEAMQDSLVKTAATSPRSRARPRPWSWWWPIPGAGVSPDDKEKLFLPYFSTKNRGTGLGLAIVSHIVAEHNAHDPGGGQPAGGRAVHGRGAGDPRNGPGGGGRASGGGGGMKQRRILVVDDEPGIRQSLGGVLEDEGYAVAAVESGESCLAALPGAGFELVLLDIWLPGMDGMEVLARIQEIPFAERPVVVMISGHGSIEAAVKATKLGAFDFLEKPLSHRKGPVVVKNALAHRAPGAREQPAEGRQRLAVADHRRERADEGAAAAAGADGGHQRARADLRRERHGQGTGGARHPRA